MSGKKKKAAPRARKVPSFGLWIAPDLERKIKGEGGRRGLSEPPYSYYLHLADIALKSSAHSAQAAPQKVTRSAPDPLDSPAIAQSLPSVPPYVANPPKPPKLTLPKPPKNPAAPKPERVARTSVQRPAPKKLTVPKPPRRRS